jgi:hypothetical protein
MPPIFDAPEMWRFLCPREFSSKDGCALAHESVTFQRIELQFNRDGALKSTLGRGKCPTIMPKTLSTTGNISVGGSLPGNIETIGDKDWFRISLIAGHQYRFDLKGHDSGYGLPDPFLRVRDSAGTPLAFDDDAGTGLDSLIIFTATYSGTYFLSVGSAVPGSGTGVYLLSAVEIGLLTPMLDSISPTSYPADNVNHTIRLLGRISRAATR